MKVETRIIFEDEEQAICEAMKDLLTIVENTLICDRGENARNVVKLARLLEEKICELQFELGNDDYKDGCIC